MVSQAPLLLKITATVMMLAMLGCLSPASRFNRQAVKQGFDRRVEGPLIVYQNGRLVDGQPIHVYLDGDGTPSLGRGRIAIDPTSRDRLILDLMDADPGSSVLVGRPCYYGANDDCDPSLWTTARYSPEVVDHLAQAINAIVRGYPASTIIVIGYSGGGTLAMLTAPAVARLDAVVTVAANLDTEAWLDHHGYGPLPGSLNPARQPPLPRRIKQFHFFGEEDDNVPPILARGVISRQENAAIEIVPGFGHKCCWPDIWASSIARIERLVVTPRD